MDSENIGNDRSLLEIFRGRIREKYPGILWSTSIDNLRASQSWFATQQIFRQTLLNVIF